MCECEYVCRCLPQNQKKYFPNLLFGAHHVSVRRPDGTISLRFHFVRNFVRLSCSTDRRTAGGNSFTVALLRARARELTALIAPFV